MLNGDPGEVVANMGVGLDNSGDGGVVGRGGGYDEKVG